MCTFDSLLMLLIALQVLASEVQKELGRVARRGVSCKRLVASKTTYSPPLAISEEFESVALRTTDHLLTHVAERVSTAAVRVLKTSIVNTS